MAEVEAREALASADAFAAAVAAKFAGNDPEVARETAFFLRNQSRFINSRTVHIDAEHARRS